MTPPDTSTPTPQRLRRRPWWSARPAWLYLLFVTMIIYGVAGLPPAEPTPLTPAPLAAVAAPLTAPPGPAGTPLRFDAVELIDQEDHVALTTWPTEAPQRTPPVAEGPHDDMAQPPADDAVDPAIREAARALQLADTTMSNAAQMLSDASSEERPAVSQR